MLSTFMLLALGFSAALLLALFLVPIIWRRAVRVTSRRLKTGPLPAAGKSLSLDPDDEEGSIADHTLNTRKLEKRLQDIKEKLAVQAVEMARHNATIDDLNKQIELKDDTLSERAAEIERLTTEMSPLNTELSSRTDEVKKLSENLEAKSSAFEKLEADLADALEIASQKDETLAQLNSANREHEQQIVDLTMARGTAEEDSAAKQQKIDELKTTLLSVREELAASETKVHRIDEATSAKDDEIDRLRTTIKTQAETLQAQELSVNKATQVTALTETELSKLRETMEMHARELATRDELIEKTRSGLEAAQAEIAELREAKAAEVQNRAAVELQLQQKIDTIETRDGEIAALRGRVEAGEAKVEENTQTTQGYSASIKVKEAEIAQLRESMGTAEEKLADVNADLALARKQLEEKGIAADSVAEALEHERTRTSETRDKLSVLQEEFDTLTLKSEQQSKDYETRIANLEGERSKLLADVNTAGLETTKLLEEVDELDQMWEQQFDRSKELAEAQKPTASAAPQSPADDEAPVKPARTRGIPSGGELKETDGTSRRPALSGGWAIARAVDRAINDATEKALAAEAAVADQANETGGEAETGEGKSLADRFRALQNRIA